MSKRGDPLIFSVSGTCMEKRFLPSLSVRHFTHLPCKTASSPPELLFPHLSPEEDTLFFSEERCRSLSQHPWCSPVLSLGVCPVTEAKCSEAMHSILLRSCQHLAEQEDRFLYCLGWTSIYTSHGDVSLSHKSMTFPIPLEHVIPHQLQALSRWSGACSVVPCSVHLPLIFLESGNLYLSLPNCSWTVALLRWDLFDC